MASTMNLLSLQKSLFVGQNNLFNHTNKPFSSTQKLRSNHAVNTTAKLSIFEIFGGRGLCNGEEGLQQELKKTVSQEPSSSVLKVEEESRIENIPEDGFDKELLGLTGGFPGGEKGLQAFIAKNPPPKKPLPSEKLVETNEKNLTKKSKPPALPLLMPGMIAIVKNPNNPYYMYCGIVQRITDGMAGVLFEGGNWDRLITFKLDELERREKGPPMVSCSMSVEKNPNNRMLGHREMVNGKHGEYVWLTYKQVYDIVMKVGNAIRSCGVQERGKCGIYGANCEEWIISMEACNAHGLYCVPLYDTLGANAVEFVMCHAEVALVFVEEKKISEVLKTLPKTKEYLKTIVSFGKITTEQKEEVEKLGLAIYSWDEFLWMGEDTNFELPVNKKTDVCTIMYTSGTTGEPKGVMISNNSIVTLIAGVKRFLESFNETLNEKDVYISYLPLAHIFDRAIEECMIMHGASIGFWRGDAKLLLEDIGVLNPTIFCAVPRVLDRIYSGLTQKIATGGLLRHTLFKVAYSYKLRGMNGGNKHDEAAPLCDKVVFNKVKQALGGRVRLILSGAAPLATHVEAYLRVVACCYVLQGYGLTETCAGTFVSLPNEQDMLGTVGPPLPNVDARLESVPEMGYDALSSTPRGEICVRGATVFSGYYKREDLTKEVLIDDWFHTGDIGEWQSNGAMKVIDRKKNIFKLAQGEYVAVENLENIYILVSDIESMWIYGNSFESFLVAVANPKHQAIERWAKENGVSGDINTLCENPKVKDYILQQLSKLGKEKQLKGFEIIKDIHLDPVPFDMDRDLITPTYKKKRPQLLKYYQDKIDKMYKQ